MADKQQWDYGRGLWLSGLFGGVSYFLAIQMGWDGGFVALWKASGVALIAAWAAANARGVDGWLIAIALAFGALGDWLLATTGLLQGGLAFAVGHVVAMGLYLRNRRQSLSSSQRALSWLLLPLAMVISWLLSRSAAPELAMAAMGYTVVVAAMATAAWTSRFPRYRTGIGAILFLASDLLIFAGEGGALAKSITIWLVWPTYFGGQALIAWGVVRTLADKPDA